MSRMLDTLKIRAKLAKIETRLTILQWSVTGLYALGLPGLWLLLRVAAKVGALGS